MRMFLTRSVLKDARKAKVSRDLFVKAIERIDLGLFDAEIGAHLFKQRVGRKGDFRVIVFLKKQERSVVLHMFPKNKQPNITGHELETLRDFARVLAGLGDEAFERLASDRGWMELDHDIP